MAQATKRHRQSREWFATAWLGLPSLLFSLDSMLWSRTGDVSKWGMWVTAHIGKHAGYKHFYFMCQRVVLLMWYFSKKHAITYLQIVGLTVSNTKPVNLFKILHGEGFSSWQTKPPVLFPQKHSPGIQERKTQQIKCFNNFPPLYSDNENIILKKKKKKKDGKFK